MSFASFATDAFIARGRLLALHEALYASYGPQHWWPGDSAFEIMTGAVLVQNTAWENAARAIAALKAGGLLHAEVIVRLSREQLAGLIRSSGYHTVKAGRLQNLCRWLAAHGGYAALKQRDTGRLRRELLEINGIGPETADAILLYAFRRPVFVVDAYTSRLFERLGLHGADRNYEVLRGQVETALGADVAMFNELHALIVRHGKVHCRKKPLCTACPVRDQCRYYAASGQL